MASREGSVESFLESLGLGEYLSIFLSEGFDTIQAIQEITEEDLEEMCVKRGHRRTLQRALGIRFATNALVDTTRLQAGSLPQAPISPPLFPGDGRLHGAFTQRTGSWDHESSQSESPLFAGVDRNLSPPQLHCGPTRINRSHLLLESPAQFCLPPKPKRRYRRHPKPDMNAPKKPLSAYVMFSKTVREELKEEKIPFPEIARIIGDRWKNLELSAKEAFEREASEQKERWSRAMMTYKTTEEYQQHRRYLQQFKEAQQVRNSAFQPPTQRCRDAGGHSARSLGGKSECNDNSCEASDVESEERDDVMSNPVISSSTSQADRGANGSYPSHHPAGGSESERPQPAASVFGYHLPPPHTSHYYTRPTIPNLRTLDQHLTESQTLFFKSNRSVRTHP